MAKGVTVVWNSKIAERQVLIGLVKRMKLLGNHLENAHVIKLSTPVVKKRKKRRRSTSRGSKGSTYTYADPSSRSKPGQYPKSETTNLRKSIFSEVEVEPLGVQLKIGTSVKYGERLETKMDRKGLRSTMIGEAPAIRSLLLTNQMENSVFQFTTRR